MRHVVPSAQRSALLGARGRGHRFSPTLSEARLWLELSAGRVLGVVFRRQVSVGGRYIADFLAPALRLVVEVDGSAHVHKRRADARRHGKLRRLGYHVLRLDAAVVLREPEAAVAAVRAAVERLR
jgi:very-short-patch-repair endonuclease